MPPVFGLRATGFTAPQPGAATSKVISSLFTDVNAAGYHVSKKKITPQGEGYRAYVLLEYPLGEANIVLSQEIKNNQIVETRVCASAAFAELEASIKASCFDLYDGGRRYGFR